MAQVGMKDGNVSGDINGIRFAHMYADDPDAAGTLADPYVRGIQNAIESWDADELVRNDVVGGIVFLKTGYFAEYKDGKSTMIQMDGDTTRPICSIIGSGMGSSVIYAPDSQNCNIIGINSQEALGALIKLSDFQVDGNHLNQTSGQGLVVSATYNIGDIRLERVFFRKVRDTYINISGFGYRINDCIVGDSTTSTLAMNLDSASWGMNHVHKCYIADMSEGGGINIVDDRITISDCDISNLEQHGIILRATTQSRIYNNRIIDFDNKSAGLYSGIYLRGDSGACSENEIYGNTITSQYTGKYGILIGKDNSDTDVNNNKIYNNNVDDPGTAELYCFPAVAQNNRLLNNVAPQPFGVVANPFENTSYVITPVGGDAATVTTASQDYLIALTRCRLISSDSGGADADIIVKDGVGGTQIANPGSTCDVWLEPGWAINWGAYTGANPTVLVAFG